MSELASVQPWPVDEDAYRDDDLYYASTATGAASVAVEQDDD